MIPTLAIRGRLVLLAGAVFTLLGAIMSAPPLVALGALSLSALLTAHLAFFPVAILLRRKKIELSWWVPPGDQPGGGLAADHPFSLHVALRNHGRRGLRVLGVEVLGTAGLDLPKDLEAYTPAGHQVELIGKARSYTCGYHVLHGAVLTFGDILHLFQLKAYFPNPVALKVFPRHALGATRAALRPRGGSRHERAGLHQIKRRGLAGELREIRDHAHGDSFKFIAWKASARKRKLMVRDLESEIIVTHQILVDIAGTMRAGEKGRTKLDYAIDAATTLARAALDNGDRVGLIAFDSRIYSQLPIGDGHQQYLKIVDRLIETQNIVDEDLVDVTDGELVAAVSKYLAHQEGIDTRLPAPPTIDDPAWERLHAGPSGELFDLDIIERVVDNLLRSMNKSTRKTTVPAWWWSRLDKRGSTNPRLAKLRLFCRLRGIELPYRNAHEFGKRALGFSQALGHATENARTDVLVVLSDLRGVRERPDTIAKTLARAQHRGQRVYAIAPYGPAFAARPTTEIGRKIASTFAAEEQAILTEGTTTMRRYGIQTLEAGPTDTGATLLTKLGRLSSRRRAA